jgi:undecaprenyl-diphosphatase
MGPEVEADAQPDDPGDPITPPVGPATRGASDGGPSIDDARSSTDDVSSPGSEPAVARATSLGPTDEAGSPSADLAAAAGTAVDVEIIEPPRPTYVRAPGDKVRVALAAAVFLVALLGAAVFRSVISGAEDDVYRLTGLVPESLARFLVTVGAYMGVLAPLALAGALIFLRRLRVAGMVVLAGVAAKLAMDGISQLLAVNVALPADLGQVRFISYPGPGFLAAGAAIVTVIDPWIPRIMRRIAIATVILVAFTRIVSGANVPFDVVMASVLGWLVGAVVVAAFGSPNRSPAGSDVVVALRKVGLVIRRLELIGRGLRGSVVYRAADTDGTDHFLKVFTADQRDADFIVQLYRWIRLREASDERPFSTLRRSVEHEALVALKAADDGIPTAALDSIVEVDPEGMLLAFEWVDGETLEGLGPDGISDEMLTSLWRMAARLRTAGIAHRDLNLAHCIVNGDGHPRVVDFSFGEVAASDALLRTDVAELLCSTSTEVGARRAVAVAVEVMGRDVVADAVGRMQPLALSVHTRKALAARDGLLDEVRDEAQHATGLEEVELEELARIRPRTVVTVVVFAVALYALLPQLADIGQVGEQLKTAEWAWLLPVIAFQCLTYLGAGLSMVGSVPDRIALVPTIRAQVAAAFVDILAPASLGGMALNTRFFQKRGVDAGVAVAGVGVNAVGGLVGHVLLLGAAVLWAGSNTLDSATTSTGSTSSDSSFPTGTVLIVAGVVLALTVAFFVSPPGRKLFRTRLRPMLSDAVSGIGQLARRPRKLLELIGGSLVITLGFTGAFVCTVEAFGGGPSVAAMSVAYLAATAFAVIAPTPGGLGAVEVLLIAALGRLGMSSEAAVSSVLVFRTFTFWLPVIPGWLTFTWMQRHKEI